MSYLNDEYALKAKKEGYVARSVYKLKEIDDKFHLMIYGAVLDIGAAPGSFSQYSHKRLKQGKLVAVDIKDLNISFEKNFEFVKGDIFTESVVKQIRDLGPYNFIMSDAAPNTTGNRLVDTSNSFNLSKKILEFALTSLNKQGNLLIKVFQGGFEREIFDIIKNRFKIAKRLKPKAVRKNSFEIYFIGKDFVK